MLQHKPRYDAIIRHYRDGFIGCPICSEDWKAIEWGLRQKWNVPNAIGAPKKANISPWNVPDKGAHTSTVRDSTPWCCWPWLVLNKSLYCTLESLLNRGDSAL